MEEYNFGENHVIDTETFIHGLKYNIDREFKEDDETIIEMIYEYNTEVFYIHYYSEIYFLNYEKYDK